MKGDIKITEEELEVLKTIQLKGLCSVIEIQETFGDDMEYLALLRVIHRLLKKKLVTKVVVGSMSFYKINAEFRAMVKQICSIEKSRLTQV